MRVYLATDHAGFVLKEALVPFVRELGHDVEDCGAEAFDAQDDYPVFVGSAARKLAADIADGIESRAIVIGGSGQGEAIVANRHKGVRAVVYYGEVATPDATLDMIVLSRQHNDTNALSLGARFLSEEMAKDAVRKWLAAPFSGEERHARRIGQIESS